MPPIVVLAAFEHRSTITDLIGLSSMFEPLCRAAAIPPTDRNPSAAARRRRSPNDWLVEPYLSCEACIVSVPTASPSRRYVPSAALLTLREPSWSQSPPWISTLASGCPAPSLTLPKQRDARPQADRQGLAASRAHSRRPRAKARRPRAHAETGTRPWHDARETESPRFVGAQTARPAEPSRWRRRAACGSSSSRSPDLTYGARDRPIVRIEHDAFEQPRPCPLSTIVKSTVAPSALP
jgi:hypothetical protein